MSPWETEVANMEGDHPGLLGTEDLPGMRDLHFETRQHGFAQDGLVNLQRGTCDCGLVSGSKESCRFEHIRSEYFSQKE